MENRADRRNEQPGVRDHGRGEGAGKGQGGMHRPAGGGEHHQNRGGGGKGRK